MIDFVSESFEEIEARLIERWEALSGRTMYPASPERVFAAWMAAAIAHGFEKINVAANQNMLSGAEGEALDALAEMLGDFPRPQPQPAVAIMIFYLDEPQGADVTIPQGTLVSDADGTAVFSTNYAGTIPAGATESNRIVAFCVQDGAAANGYAAGQISRFYGGFSGADRCANIAPTQDGRDVMTDEDYRAYLKAKLAGYSVAGSRRAYEHIAKNANDRIIDVCVVTPEEGEVAIYALIDDGYIAPSGIKGEILAACSADTVRPLTDHVTVEDAEEVRYQINATYYIRSDVTASAAEVEAALSEAVEAFRIWQASRFGRDINPSKLTQMLMDTGFLSRVEITKPVYTPLSDGKDGNPPEHANCEISALDFGGVEDV